MKSFTKRHRYDNQQDQHYDLKPNDILDASKFHEFIHSNRAKVAQVIRYCWCHDELISLLPANKQLVVAGPRKEAIKLMSSRTFSSRPSKEILHNLESDHMEADTRIFLHVYDIQMDDDGQNFDGIMIQSNDTDIFILSLSRIKLMMLPNYFIKKVNTLTKLFTFINLKKVEELIQQKWSVSDLSVFLSLHAISGCDTTSFTRNITKVNYFLTYLSNPLKYHNLKTFGDDLIITIEPLQAAEELLVSCYKNSRSFKSLSLQPILSTTSTTDRSGVDSLNAVRKSIALKYYKSSTADLCTKLPPTSDAFQQHCHRAWRQVYTWRKTFEQYDIIGHYPMEQYGYQLADDGDFIIRWMTISAMPNDLSLTKCVKCTNGCNRCKCSTNNLFCTPSCGCSIDQCKNRASTQVKS